MLRKNVQKRLNHPRVNEFIQNHLPKIQKFHTPEQVWLFGSYAHGKPQRWSDLDLLIVSKKFARGERTKRRSSFLVKTGIWDDHEFIVDPLCYTPAEFERWKDAPTIISEIVKTGIRLIRDNGRSRMNQSDLLKDLPITIDPEIHSGTPVFRGTRVPIQVLFNNLADGYALDDILDNYPSIKREDAIKLLEAAPQYLTGVLQLENSVR